MADADDFTLRITIMPPEPAPREPLEDELVPTQRFTRAAFAPPQRTGNATPPSVPPSPSAPPSRVTPRSVPPSPSAPPSANRRPAAGGLRAPTPVPLPLRAGTLHPLGPLPRPPAARPGATTPVPAARVTSARVTTARVVTPRVVTAPARTRAARPNAAGRRRWARALLQRFHFDCA